MAATHWERRRREYGLTPLEKEWNRIWEKKGWASLPIRLLWKDNVRALQEIAVGSFCCIEVQPGDYLGMDCDYAFLAEYIAKEGE